jgi:hypothetical protein
MKKTTTTTTYVCGDDRGRAVYRSPRGQYFRVDGVDSVPLSLDDAYECIRAARRRWARKHGVLRGIFKKKAPGRGRGNETMTAEDVYAELITAADKRGRGAAREYLIARAPRTWDMIESLISAHGYVLLDVEDVRSAAAEEAEHDLYAAAEYGVEYGYDYEYEDTCCRCAMRSMSADSRAIYAPGSEPAYIKAMQSPEDALHWICS